MIIKRWNGTVFVKEFPQTKAQLIRNADDDGNIFDNEDKIFPTYLPNSVFDGLRFYSTTSGNVGAAGTRLLLATELLDAKEDADVTNSRSITGYYFVISVAGTITGLTGIEETVNYPGTYVTLQFRPQDGGTNFTPNTSSGALEPGDWFVIESVTGAGTLGNPYIFTAAVINNTYENATTAIDGIVRLSSRTTYASLSGNNVVGESTLKTVIDNAAFASGTHVHGSILNGGTITAAVVAPADTDVLLISDTSNSGKIERGIALGTSTTTFLNNTGGFSTPAGTFVHPTQTAINTDATNDGITVIDSVVVNTLGHVTSVGTRTLSAATASVPGHMTAAFATKLDGIAAGAQVNVATNITYTDATRIIASSTGTGATLPEVVAAGVSGLMTGADKTKLNGIATGANAFVHPTQTAIDVNATDDGISVIDRVQVNTAGHVTSVTTRNLSAATASVPGHMTAAFASKLDGITAGATNQTALALGGLQISSNAFSMVNPFFSQLATPATPLTGTVWFDIN